MSSSIRNSSIIYWFGMNEFMFCTILKGLCWWFYTYSVSFTWIFLLTLIIVWTDRHAFIDCAMLGPPSSWSRWIFFYGLVEQRVHYSIPGHCCNILEFRSIPPGHHQLRLVAFCQFCWIIVIWLWAFKQKCSCCCPWSIGISKVLPENFIFEEEETCTSMSVFLEFFIIHYYGPLLLFFFFERWWWWLYYKNIHSPHQI